MANAIAHLGALGAGSEIHLGQFGRNRPRSKSKNASNWTAKLLADRLCHAR